MRILIISNLYPSAKDPSYGTFVKNFVSQVNDSGKFSTVHLCVIEGRTTSIFKKILKYLKFYIQIIFRLLFFKYDIVYTHIITHAAIPLRVVRCIKKFPTIFNIHGEDLITKTKLSESLLKLVTPLLHESLMIVVPSNYFKSILLDMMPSIDSQKIYISASGGVSKLFFREHDSYTESHSFKIGYVSRIDRGKGWDTFIDAISLIECSGVEMNVTIAGTGAQVDIMLDYIKQKNINNISYLGPIPYSELPSHYSNLDLFVFPTKLDESLGLVGLEAMACYVPVIGSYHAGLTDYLIDGYNGISFKAGDANSLAQAILKYLRFDKATRVKMRQNANLTASRYS